MHIYKYAQNGNSILAAFMIIENIKNKLKKALGALNI